MHAERTHAQQWTLSSASSARLPRIANPPRLSDPSSIPLPLKDPPRRAAAPPSAPSATSAPSGGSSGNSAPAPHPVAAERGVREVYEALSAREKRKLRSALFPLRARAAESASAVWQASWGVVARLVAAELVSAAPRVRASPHFSPPSRPPPVPPSVGPHILPPNSFTPLLFVSSPTSLSLLLPTPHYSPPHITYSPPHITPHLCTTPPACCPVTSPCSAPPHPTPSSPPSPPLPLFLPSPSPPRSFQGEPGEEGGGEGAGGRRGGGCDAETHKRGEARRVEEQGQVLCVVEVLSEGVVRAGRGAVAAGEVEELVWAPFVKTHQALLSPEHWSSFVPLLLKLVARHGALLLGKRSNGRLVKNMTHWLLHCAVFAAHAAVRERALVGLLLLIADSVRESGTVAAITVSLTLSSIDLLTRPCTPLYPHHSPSSILPISPPSPDYPIPTHQATESTQLSHPTHPTHPAPSALKPPPGWRGGAHTARGAAAACVALTASDPLRPASGVSSFAPSWDPSSLPFSSPPSLLSAHAAACPPAMASAPAALPPMAQALHLGSPAVLDPAGIGPAGLPVDEPRTGPGRPRRFGRGETEARGEGGLDSWGRGIVEEGTEEEDISEKSWNGEQEVRPVRRDGEGAAGGGAARWGEQREWDKEHEERFRAVLRMVGSGTQGRRVLGAAGLGEQVLADLARRWRWGEVKALSAVLRHAVAAWQELDDMAQSAVQDRQAVVEGYLHCASACSHAPDLHVLFLLRLALAHRHLDPLGGAAEAGQCCVAAAAVALQYLLALHPHPPRDHSTTHFASGDEAVVAPGFFSRAGGQRGSHVVWGQQHVGALALVCPDLPLLAPGLLRAASNRGTVTSKRRSKGGQKSGGGSGGGGEEEESVVVVVAGRVAGYLHVNPLFIASLLEEASSLFASAGLHSFALHLQELLLPFWKAHGNFSAASRCHRRLAASYLLLTERPGGGGEEGLREGGCQQSCVHGASFFLVAFYGERFGAGFNGRQFVYKEPRWVGRARQGVVRWAGHGTAWCGEVGRARHSVVWARHSVVWCGEVGVVVGEGGRMRGTSAADLVRRLRGIYDRILGSSTSLRIITSPILTPHHLRHSQLCTVQVVPVYPAPVDPPPGLPEGEEGLREGKEGAARGDLDELFGASASGRGPLRAFQFGMPPSALAAAAAAAIEGLVEGGGEGRAGGGAGGEEGMRLLELGFGGAGGMGYGMGSGALGDASCEIADDFTSGSALGRGAVFPVWRHRMVLTVHPRFPSLQLHLPVVATHTVEASPLELVLDESMQWTRRLTQLVATWRAKTGGSLEEDGTKKGDGGRRSESGVQGYDVDEDHVLWGMGGRGRRGRRSGSGGGRGEGWGRWRVLLQVAAASLDAMDEVQALPLLRSLKERPAGGGGGGGGGGRSKGTYKAGEAYTDTGRGLERGKGAKGGGEGGGAGEGSRGGWRWAEGVASQHVVRAMGEVVAAAEAAREGVEGVGKPLAPLLAWLEDAALATPPETLAALARYGLLDGGTGGDVTGGGVGVCYARGEEGEDEGSSAAAAAAAAVDGAAGGDATPGGAHPTPRELAREREQRKAEREIAAVAALAAAAAAGGEEAVRVGNALTDYVEALSAVVQAHEREMGWGDEEAHEEVKARAKGMMEELYLYVPGIRPWALV
ncbi:unnamed protein product [Closterium sp. Yama58-4]|nr:unnamed protein product [Closterium sp. Yama58-4]